MIGRYMRSKDSLGLEVSSHGIFGRGMMLDRLKGLGTDGLGDLIVTVSVSITRSGHVR